MADTNFANEFYNVAYFPAGAYQQLHSAMLLVEAHDSEARLTMYFQAMENLGMQFSKVYKGADGAQDENVKRRVVKEFTDFILKTAYAEPGDTGRAQVVAEAVEALCTTLKETVKDKSLIPSNFSFRLMNAAAAMHERKNQKSAYGDLCKEVGILYAMLADHFAPEPPRPAATRPPAPGCK